MPIIKATLDHLMEASDLFNLYRIFYKQESDLDGACRFLKERIEKEESVIFLAYQGEQAVGFAQAYPAFSSVSLKRTWILNDLYVKKEDRGHGIGEELLTHVIEFAKETGTKGILLETAEDNRVAQSLYEKKGFEREDNRFYFRSV
ncbi:GNAT family N-acetyltransferase [Pullulanibacillus sp. KACC 23026]|uniref:GNAT family N-acetyltransferase n=1 Tax=Pullulanibacillus sp. KACC 23026 TaxID=3028315 RepID=UPI0023B0D452|nr:GNAT family N-acetyltransferase [Pullulanibacillus sp. KACC 23026]WEG12372.1 GNAT family N-acetyltransferase [Pullulanibacillus sp. KACC 23026]